MMPTFDEAVKGLVRKIPERVEQRVATALRSLDTADGFESVNPKVAKELARQAERTLGRCVEDAQKFANTLARSPRPPKPTGNTRADLVTLRAWAERAVARRGKLPGKRRPPPAWYEQAWKLRMSMREATQAQLALVLSTKLKRPISQQAFSDAVRKWEAFLATSGIQMPSVLAGKGRTRMLRLTERALDFAARPREKDVSQDEN